MENNELLLAVKGLLEENNEAIFKRIDGVKDELNAKIDSLDKKVDTLDKKVDTLDKKVDSNKDEIISYIKQNNVAIAEMITESAEKTEAHITSKIDELKNVTAKNCYDITELRARAK